MVNWKVRVANKTFWILFIPAVLLLVKTVADAFGVELNLGETQANLLAIVEALFAVLTVTGCVVDPTTVGIGDSERALSYDVPSE